MLLSNRTDLCAHGLLALLHLYIHVRHSFTAGNHDHMYTHIIIQSRYKYFPNHRKSPASFENGISIQRGPCCRLRRWPPWPSCSPLALGPVSTQCGRRVAPCRSESRLPAKCVTIWGSPRWPPNFETVPALSSESRSILPAACQRKPPRQHQPAARRRPHCKHEWVSSKTNSALLASTFPARARGRTKAREGRHPHSFRFRQQLPWSSWSSPRPDTRRCGREI